MPVFPPGADARSDRRGKKFSCKCSGFGATAAAVRLEIMRPAGNSALGAKMKRYLAIVLSKFLRRCSCVQLAAAQTKPDMPCNPFGDSDSAIGTGRAIFGGTRSARHGEGGTGGRGAKFVSDSAM
jgi:hypothetical protein